MLQATKADGRDTFDRAMWTVVENKAHVCDMVNAGGDITLPTDAVAHAALNEWYRNL